MRNIESGKFSIEAPNSEVTLTLSSLHDTSRVKAKHLTLYVGEEMLSQIRLVKNGEIEGTTGPALFIECPQVKVHALNKFELFKMQFKRD